MFALNRQDCQISAAPSVDLVESLLSYHADSRVGKINSDRRQNEDNVHNDRHEDELDAVLDRRQTQVQVVEQRLLKREAVDRQHGR